MSDAGAPSPVADAGTARTPPPADALPMGGSWPPAAWLAAAAACAALFGLLTLDIARDGLVARMDGRASGWVLENVPDEVRTGFELGASAPGGSPVVQLVALVLAIAIARRRPLWGGLYVGSLVGTQLIVHALKEWTARPRPSVGLTSSMSFPSGHSAQAAVAYLLAALLLVRVYDRPRRWELQALGIAAALILLTGVGRFLGGVHYLGDILGGYLLGLAVVCTLMASWKYGVLRARAAGDTARPGQAAAPAEEAHAP